MKNPAFISSDSLFIRKALEKCRIFTGQFSEGIKKTKNPPSALHQRKQPPGFLHTSPKPCLDYFSCAHRSVNSFWVISKSLETLSSFLYVTDCRTAWNLLFSFGKKKTNLMQKQTKRLKNKQKNHVVALSFSPTEPMTLFSCHLPHAICIKVLSYLLTLLLQKIQLLGRTAVVSPFLRDVM